MATGDACYSSRQQLVQDSWKKEDLDQKNIFFNAISDTLPAFLQRIKERASTCRGTIFKCVEDLPEIVKDLISYSSEALTFSFEQESDDDPVKESTYAAYKDVCSMVKQFDSYACRLMDEKKDLNHSDRKLLSAWCTKTEDFIKSLKLFFLTKLVDTKESRSVGQYQELLMDFTRIFNMKPELGVARKREVEINGSKVCSIPDIHYVKDMNPLIGTLLVMSLEVKGTVLDMGEMVRECFKANEMIDSRVLGQHGGELLLEKDHSAFDPKVLGMLCHKSKIIFTYMDMKSSHYDKILTEGEVTDARHKCFIYYTRPYDFLVKEDRDEIMELMFWIGCVQSLNVEDVE